jgi:hypothetical protein
MGASDPAAVRLRVLTDYVYEAITATVESPVSSVAGTVTRCSRFFAPRERPLLTRAIGLRAFTDWGDETTHKLTVAPLPTLPNRRATDPKP